MHTVVRSCCTLRLIFGIVLAHVVFMGSLSGCGYTLAGSAPGGVTSPITLAVTPFINQTREPALESHLQDALRRALVQHRMFNLTSEGKALRLLEGTIRRFHIVPLSFDANDNALQYRLEADIVIRLVDATEKTITLEHHISAWADYLVSSTGVVRENMVARETALAHLAEQFASKCATFLMVMLLS